MEKHLSVEQKLTKAMLDLRQLRPFYSGVYEVMEKEPCDTIDTIAVSLEKIFYNEKFIDETTYPEVLFTVLHAVAHIALRHITRREQRDPLLWNQACDLYVNKLLSSEFQLPAPGVETKQGTHCSITMPLGSFFHPDLDLEVDFVEKLYQELKVSEESSDDKEPDGSDGDGGDDQENQEGTVDENKEGGNPQNEDGEEEEQDENLTDDPQTDPATDDSQDTTADTKEDTQEQSQDATGSDSEEDNAPENPTDSNADSSKQTPTNAGNDLIDSLDDPLTQQRKAEKLLKEAQTKGEMNRQALGIGDTTSLLEREVQRSLRSQLDWRKLLRSYLRAADPSDMSFSTPDRRFFYQDTILPGVNCEELHALFDVKICIDTSGSITPDDLSDFYGEVWCLCKQFQIKAELLFWDVEIENSGEFENYKEMTYTKARGGGGTDPSCLFDYFESKLCKQKPAVTLIFTDGYLGEKYNKPRRGRRFKNTIWVMTDGANPTFQPAFGVVAPCKKQRF